MRIVVLIIGLICIMVKGYTQCPSRLQLYAELLSMEELGSKDSLGIVQQQNQIQSWMNNWKNCYAIADTSYVLALDKMAMLYLTQGNNKEAYQRYRQVIGLYKNPEPGLKFSDLARTYLFLGAYLQFDDDYENSLVALLKVLEIARKYPEANQWAASAFIYITYYYFLKGDLEKALLYANQGEKIILQYGKATSISQFLEQKAQALDKLGRYEEARKALLKAISYIEKLPDQNNILAGQERLLGSVLKNMNHTGESLIHYHRAYAIARKNGHENLSDFTNSLGFYYYDLGEYTQALEYFKETLRINKSGYSKSIYLDNFGLVYRKLKNYPLSLKYHQKALNELSFAYTDTSVTSLPTAQTIRSEPQKEYFLECVQDKADTWLSYARNSGNNTVRLQQALRTYMLADSMIDYMRWEHSIEGSKLYWRTKTRKMYENAIETCYLLHDGEAALYFFEKSRAVLLSDKLNELNASQRLSPAEAELEKMLRLRSNELQGKLGQLNPTDAAAAPLRTQLLDLQKEQEAFLKKIESSNPQYYRYKYDNHVPDLKHLRQNLRSVSGRKGTFLTYFLGDSSLYGISVSSDKILFKKLQRKEFLKNKGIFTSLLINREQQNRQFKQYLTAAHGLYRTLLAPFAIPKDTRLIISPDGDFIPFAAMSLSDQKPDYLVRYHPISYTYSAHFLELFTKPAQPGWWSQGTFLGMAPVKFSSSMQLAALSGSDVALTDIEKHFFLPKSLTRQEATRRAFIEQAPGFRIVQLYTHAEADSLQTPRLYFADSVLSLPELAAVGSFSTQLMVLSACKTGIGKLQQGEGVFSLARGLAGLGIPSTLTTLWSVENQAMYGLNEFFYKYLAEDLPLDEALQKAQLDWLNSASRSDQLPYAWAGVVLIGRTDPVPGDPISKMGYLTMALAVGVGLIGLSNYYYRKRKG